MNYGQLNTKSSLVRMNNREDVKNFILEIERNFPVNEWAYDNIHIWPLIRIKIFFHLIGILESHASQKNTVSTLKIKENEFRPKRLINRFITFFKNKISRIGDVFFYLIWYYKLPIKSNLFLGNKSHRIIYRNKRFNRFFDLIIEKQNLQNDAFFFEYDDTNNENIYNRDIIFRFNKSIRGFITLNRFKARGSLNLKGYDEFLEFLSETEITKRALNKINPEIIRFWFDDFWLRLTFFKKILNRIQPKYVYILCYYSNVDTFALVCAANQLGKSTIEMQHGPQTDVHLCYGSWFSIPDNGYDLLPRSYFCWDDITKETMTKWTSKCNLYSAINFGNPWVDYWKNKDEKYAFQNFVLYCLQGDITIEKLFPEVLIKLIEECKRTWFIRLHPRQLDDQNLILDFLTEKRIKDKINLIEATYDPLPLLLSNAFLHVTHFSGSTIEASFFGVKTILINEIGFHSFPKLVANGQAHYLDYRDEDFYSKMNVFLNDDRN